MAKPTKAELFKAEIKATKALRQLPEVKGWESGERNTHVNNHVERERASGHRVEPAPTLDDYDRFGGE